MAHMALSNRSRPVDCGLVELFSGNSQLQFPNWSRPRGRPASCAELLSTAADPTGPAGWPLQLGRPPAWPKLATFPSHGSFEPAFYVSLCCFFFRVLSHQCLTCAGVKCYCFVVEEGVTLKPSHQWHFHGCPSPSCYFVTASPSLYVVEWVAHFFLYVVATSYHDSVWLWSFLFKMCLSVPHFSIW